MSTAHPLITAVPVPEFEPKLRFHDPILLAGSCFTEHIGDKLLRYKYDVLNNPFGILYNPVSLARSMKRIADQQFYTADELVMKDGYYHSMDHHGSYSGNNKENVLERINKSIEAAHRHLSECVVAFISPGTSKVYRYKETGNIAGNNHKIPGSSFVAEQLSAQDCAEAFENIILSLRKVAPAMRIVWTISPVRHMRDGMIENQKSKATLLLAVHEVMRKFPETLYFPAYEIMMDELRDYRFYARDLIHPSALAIDLIWDRFSPAYLDPIDREYHPAIEKIKRATEHRFLYEDRDAIRSFATGQLKQIDTLASQLPDLNWQPERQYFFQYLELD